MTALEELVLVSIGIESRGGATASLASRFDEIDIDSISLLTLLLSLEHEAKFDLTAFSESVEMSSMVYVSDLVEAIVRVRAKTEFG